MTEENPTSEADSTLDAADQRTEVRNRYGEIAAESDSCCGEAAGSAPDERARKLGYDDEEIDAVPEGANLGLSCGNPKALASLEAGERVLDLGSGAGFDCLLAATEVGPGGQVIGVDMTPEMVEKAREKAADRANVEFRLGEIEHLPVADASVDVVISNCVINLSPEKPQVFREAYRVLEPGGRLAIADVVLRSELPPEAIETASVADCVGGASRIPALETMLADAGFTGISIEPEEESESVIREWDEEIDPSEYIVSATIEATKPVAES